MLCKEIPYVGVGKGYFRYRIHSLEEDLQSYLKNIGKAKNFVIFYFVFQHILIFLTTNKMRLLLRMWLFLFLHMRYLLTYKMPSSNTLAK